MKESTKLKTIEIDNEDIKTLRWLIVSELNVQNMIPESKLIQHLEQLLKKIPFAVET